MADYSYDRFRHLFKQTYGVSPGEYILNKRIKHAIELLLHTHISITSIAMECGFSTDAQFCTLFKREIGESPRSYRIHRQVNEH
ncbi:Exoenzyme S synthesis regulatory protein ExsA [compost metagenome]